MKGRLKGISVGQDSVWGVNVQNDILMRTGKTGWKQIPGKLTQVGITLN